MAKRKSRENARDRKCSEDMSDDGKTFPKKKKARADDSDTTWVDDDTLLIKDDQTSSQETSVTDEDDQPIHISIQLLFSPF